MNCRVDICVARGCDGYRCGLLQRPGFSNDGARDTGAVRSLIRDVVEFDLTFLTGVLS
jgi:hypothetical protein